MRDHLTGLYEIQKIDSTIHLLQQKRQTIPTELSHLETQRAALKDELSSLGSQSEDCAKEAANLQSVIQGETIKLKKWEARLKEIRNQREFQALSREIEGAKRSNKDTEEKIIELWKRKEELDAQIEDKTTALVDMETVCSERREQVGEALAEVEGSLASETARRDELQPSIPERIWGRYTQIRDRRRGVGLVLASRGSCQGCNVRLPPQLFNILQRGDTMEQCPSCRRILLFEGFTELAGVGAESTAAEVSA